MFPIKRDGDGGPAQAPPHQHAGPLEERRQGGREEHGGQGAPWDPPAAPVRRGRAELEDPGCPVPRGLRGAAVRRGGAAGVGGCGRGVRAGVQEGRGRQEARGHPRGVRTDAQGPGDRPGADAVGAVPPVSLVLQGGPRAALQQPGAPVLRQSPEPRAQPVPRGAILHGEAPRRAADAALRPDGAGGPPGAGLLRDDLLASGFGTPVGASASGRRPGLASAGVSAPSEEGLGVGGDARHGPPRHRRRRGGRHGGPPDGRGIRAGGAAGGGRDARVPHLGRRPREGVR